MKLERRESESIFHRIRDNWREKDDGCFSGEKMVRLQA